MRNSNLPFPMRSKGLSIPPEAAKAIDVAKGQPLGQAALQYQQATSRVIYDTIDIGTQSIYSFFRDCSTRNFPDTNMRENKLEINEALVIQNIRFSIVDKTGGVLVTIQDFDTAGISQLRGAQFSIKKQTKDLTKPIPLTVMTPEFNYMGNNADAYNYNFRTMLAILQLETFQVDLEVTNLTTTPATAIRCELEGYGLIASPNPS